MTPLTLIAAFSGGAAVTGLTLSAVKNDGLKHLLDWFSPDALPASSPVEELPPAPPVPTEWLFYGGARPEPLGWPAESVLAVRGLKNHPTSVLRKLLDFSDSLGLPVDTLASVIAHESGWNPKALYWLDKNKDGSRRKTPFVAAGLCQLTTAAQLEGFDTWEKVKEVASWSAERQLEEVVFPLWRKYGNQLRGAHPGQGLMLNFYPDKAGQSIDTVLGEKDAPGFSGRVYAMNKGFDPSGKGKIQIADVYASAEKTCRAAKGVRLGSGGQVFVPRREKPNRAATKAPPKKVATDLPIPSPTQAEQPRKPLLVVATEPNTAAPKDAKETPSLVPITAAHTVLQTPVVEVSTPAPSAEKPLVSVESSSVMPSPVRTVKLSDPAGGLLLEAIRANADEPVTWVEVPWEGRGSTAGMRLTLKVSAHAVRAPVNIEGLGTRLLRLPIRYREQLEVCRLRKWFPLTQSISDAIWFAARRMTPVTLGRWDTPEHQAESSRRMGTIEWSVQFNDKLDAQIPDGGWNRLWAPEGKEWIVHPKLAQGGGKGAVNYGLHKTDATPTQPPGAAHNWDHYDYSQTLRALQWEGTDPTGAKVPLIDLLRKAGMSNDVLGPLLAI